MFESELHPYIKGQRVYKENPGVFNTSIYEAEKDPSLIVKELDANLDSVKKTYATIQNQLKDIFPQMQLVTTGNDVHDETGFLIMEKVEPVEINENYYSQLDNLLERVCNHYLKTFNRNKIEPDWGKGVGEFVDISDSNLIFGTTKSQSSPQLYCVDIYPFFTFPLEPVEIKIQNVIDENRSHYNFPKTKIILEKLKQLKSQQ